VTVQRSTILELESTTAHCLHANSEDAPNSYIPEALYWEKYYHYPDINYEWNNGQLEVVPAADHAKYIMYLRNTTQLSSSKSENTKETQRWRFAPTA
jgi:hypothetical protein